MKRSNHSRRNVSNASQMLETLEGRQMLSRTIAPAPSGPPSLISTAGLTTKATTSAIPITQSSIAIKQTMPGAENITGNSSLEKSPNQLRDGTTPGGLANMPTVGRPTLPGGDPHGGGAGTTLNDPYARQRAQFGVPNTAGGLGALAANGGAFGIGTATPSSTNFPTGPAYVPISGNDAFHTFTDGVQAGLDSQRDAIFSKAGVGFGLGGSITPGVRFQTNTSGFKTGFNSTPSHGRDSIGQNRDVAPNSGKNALLMDGANSKPKETTVTEAPNIGNVDPANVLLNAIGVVTGVGGAATKGAANAVFTVVGVANDGASAGMSIVSPPSSGGDVAVAVIGGANAVVSAGATIAGATAIAHGAGALGVGLAIGGLVDAGLTAALGKPLGFWIADKVNGDESQPDPNAIGGDGASPIDTSQLGGTFSSARIGKPGVSDPSKDQLNNQGGYFFNQGLAYKAKTGQLVIPGTVSRNLVTPDDQSTYEPTEGLDDPQDPKIGLIGQPGGNEPRP